MSISQLCISVPLSTSCTDFTVNSKFSLINGMRLFFPEKRTNFLFQELPEEIQNKIVYVYSEINEYSLRSRDVHSTPSWHKWSDFEYSPWCLAIVVHTPPGVLHILIVPYLKLNQRCKSLKFILWAPICFFCFCFFLSFFLEIKSNESLFYSAMSFSASVGNYMTS